MLVTLFYLRLGERKIDNYNLIITINMIPRILSYLLEQSNWFSQLQELRATLRITTKIGANISRARSVRLPNVKISIIRGWQP